MNSYSRQCLHLPTLSQDVILCTHFCQLVGHTHVLTDATPTSPVPCKQKGVTGVYSVLSTEKNPLSAYSMLTRSPMKVCHCTLQFKRFCTFTFEPNHRVSFQLVSLLMMPVFLKRVDSALEQQLWKIVCLRMILLWIPHTTNHVVPLKLMYLFVSFWELWSMLMMVFCLQ